MKLLLFVLGLTLCVSRPSFRNLGDTTTTTTTTTQPATNNAALANNTNDDEFVKLTTSEIQTSGEVQSALKYSTNQIINSSIAKGKIPVANYTITKINSVERKTQPQTNGTNTYRCDVELQGAKKIIGTQFNVSVNISTQQFTLDSWTSSIANLNSTNTPPPVNTNNTGGNFTVLSKAEIAKPEVQGALKYGANQVIQNAKAKGKIPVANYTITKVNSVGKQVSSNGRNAYQCDVELQNANKVLVKAQFVVNVKVATQERSMGAYSFQVSNLGGGSKSSANTKTR